MTEASVRHKLATKLLLEGRADEALCLADDLLRESYPPALALKGMIFELRADKHRSFEKALGFYRQAEVITRDPKLHLHLGRAYLKFGDFESALRHAELAMDARVFPDSYLLSADIISKRFEEVTPSAAELEKAGRLYLRAAMWGRIVGLQRYAQVKLALKQRSRFFLSVFAIIIARPLLWLLLGPRRNWTY